MNGRNRGTTWILAATVLASFAGTALALEGGEVPITIDLTFMSQYIWRGFDTYGIAKDKDFEPAFQPSVNVDFWDSGLSFNLWGSFAMVDRGDGKRGLPEGLSELDELDYTVAWTRTFWEEEVYALDFLANVIYYDFPNANSSWDYVELGFGIAFPNLLPLGPGNLVPSYYFAYDRMVESGADRQYGMFHIFGLGYDLPIQPLFSGQEEQALSFFTDVTYNDGFYFGARGDRDWSHSTLGVSTTFEFGSFYFTPMMAYQFSFEDDVNDEDEFYCGIGMGFSF